MDPHLNFRGKTEIETLGPVPDANVCTQNYPDELYVKIMTNRLLIAVIVRSSQEVKKERLLLAELIVLIH